MAWSLLGILLLAYVVGRFLLRPLRVIFPPLAVSLLLVYLLSPPVSWLERKGVPRTLAAVCIYLLFLGGAGTLVALIVPVLGHEARQLVEGGPAMAARVWGMLVQSLGRVAPGLEERLTMEAVLRWVTQNQERLIGYGLRLVSFTGGLLHTVLALVVGPIAGFYVLVDLPRLRAGALTLLPPAARGEVTGILERAGRAVGGFFRGQLLVALFVAVATGLGFLFIRLPYAVAIGAFAGFANLIPTVGPVVATVVGGAVGLVASGPALAIKAVVVAILVQQVDNHLVSPNVVGRTVRLHPVTIMAALLIGGELAGLWGMLVTVPVVAAAKEVFLYLWASRMGWGPGVEAGGEGTPGEGGQEEALQREEESGDAEGRATDPGGLGEDH